MLGSTSYLGLYLVCTNGTPVADMLAHSPPLPLVIDYFDRITAEDEEGMFLALKQRDRVHRVRLDSYILMSVKQKFIAAMDEEYPILEYLIIRRQLWDSTSLTLPETLQAPHLRHLMLAGFTLPVESPLLMAAVGLTTLSLQIDDPSIYLHPDTLLQWLSLMPQLEVLWIFFVLPDPNCDVGRQLEGQLTHHSPTTILPNLRYFVFRGVSAHLEAIFHRIVTPRLQKLEMYFYNQFTFSVPRFLQFLNTNENLRFGSAKFESARGVVIVKLYPREDADSETFTLDVQ